MVMSADRREEVLDQLDAQIFTDSRSVNYKSVAFCHNLPILDARDILSEFAQKHADKVISFSRLVGTRKAEDGSDVLSVVICPSSELSSAKATFSQIHSSQIYAIRAKQTDSSVSVDDVERAVVHEMDDRLQFLDTTSKDFVPLMALHHESAAYIPGHRARLPKPDAQTPSAPQAVVPPSSASSVVPSASTSSGTEKAAPKAAGIASFLKGKDAAAKAAPPSTAASFTPVFKPKTAASEKDSKAKSAAASFFAKAKPKDKKPISATHAQLDDDDGEDVDMPSAVIAEEEEDNEGNVAMADVESEDSDAAPEDDEEDIYEYARRAEEEAKKAREEERKRQEKVQREEDRKRAAERSLGIKDAIAPPAAKKARVKKVRTFKDSEGYLVTEEYWEDEDTTAAAPPAAAVPTPAPPAPKEVPKKEDKKPIVPSAAPEKPKAEPKKDTSAAAAAEPKKQQKSIASFFKK
jgi:hypothetical protein